MSKYQNRHIQRTYVKIGKLDEIENTNFVPMTTISFFHIMESFPIVVTLLYNKLWMIYPENQC